MDAKIFIIILLLPLVNAELLVSEDFNDKTIDPDLSVFDGLEWKYCSGDQCPYGPGKEGGLAIHGNHAEDACNPLPCAYGSSDAAFSTIGYVNSPASKVQQGIYLRWYVKYEDSYDERENLGALKISKISGAAPANIEIVWNHGEMFKVLFMQYGRTAESGGSVAQRYSTLPSHMNPLSNGNWHKHELYLHIPASGDSTIRFSIDDVQLYNEVSQNIHRGPYNNILQFVSIRNRDEPKNRYLATPGNGDWWWDDVTVVVGEGDLTNNEPPEPDGEVICDPNSYQSCYNNDLYWYDSCGAREDIAQDCASGCSGNACDVPAKPTINSVPTSISDGATITIQGANFGNKDPVAPLSFLDFEDGTTGQDIDQPGTDAVSLGWYTSADYADGKPEYSSARSYSGTKSMLSNPEPVQRTKSALNRLNYNKQTYYLTYNSYLHGYTTSSGTKLFRVQAGNEPECILSWASAYPGPGNYAAISCYQKAGAPSGLKYPPVRVDEWQRHEFWLDQGTVDNADAYYDFWTHRMNQPSINKISDSDFVLLTDNTRINHVLVGREMRSSSSVTGTPDSDTPMQHWLDDVYVDDTRARIEIGDNPVFETCNKRMIQIPSSWSENSITFKARTKEFSGQAYLFVVNEHGIASDGKPVSIGGSPTCNPHSYTSCYNNDLYWYDSCGAREELAQTCSNGCSGNACSQVPGSLCDNLVMLHRFDYSSAVQTDASGSGNDATVNGATWSGDRQSYSFDGNDLMTVSDFSYGPQYSISFWFKAGAGTGNAMYILSHEGYNYPDSFNAVFGTDGKMVVCIRDSNDDDCGGNTLEATNLDDGQWHHVAVSVSGESVLYVDGTEKARLTRGGDSYNPATDIILGQSSVRTDRAYKGMIDDIAIWNRALSAQEVAEINSGISCGCMELSDLITAVEQWKSNQLSMQGLLAAIKEWKNGC